MSNPFEKNWGSIPTTDEVGVKAGPLIPPGGKDGQVLTATGWTDPPVPPGSRTGHRRLTLEEFKKMTSGAAPQPVKEDAMVLWDRYFEMAFKEACALVGHDAVLVTEDGHADPVRWAADQADLMLAERQKRAK